MTKLEKSIVAFALVMAISLFLMPGATYSNISDELEAIATVTTADISIELTDPAFARQTGGTNLLENMEPGKFIDKDPVVENTGNRDVYVRVSVELEPAWLDLSDFSVEWRDSWRMGTDGFVYLTEKLEPGQTMRLFENISEDQEHYTMLLPWQWTQETAPESFSIDIYPEAVQADHFKVDFDGDVLWVGPTFE